MPSGRVIGFLHADHHFSGRDVDELDRDTVWTFAEGFGFAVERAALLERLREQRRQIEEMVSSAAGIMDRLCDADVELVGSGFEMGAHVARSAAQLFAVPDERVEGLLTRREIEVLGLMAEGATNASISDELVISEGTVKSHVKHILRKLRAANRAEAVSRYMKLRAAPPRASYFPRK
jgi:LuxR family transcriptional regulator, regulator of acetate metabolism